MDEDLSIEASYGSTYKNNMKVTSRRIYSIIHERITVTVISLIDFSLTRELGRI